MKNSLIILRLVCCITVAIILQGCNKTADSPPPQSTLAWEKANDFYQKKSWDSAIVYYKDIINKGAADAAVYYDLGNAYYNLGHTGLAILNYRKALLRKPGYTVAAENLELAETRIPGRLQAPEDIFFLRWWRGVSNPRYSAAWAIFALVFFIGALIFIWRILVKKNSVAPQIIVASFLLWGICLAMAIVSAQQNDGGRAAVVIRSKVTLKSAEGDNIAGIPEGTIVENKSIRGGDIEVALPDGRSGWLSVKDIALID